jgi:hypothetical protein
MHHEPVFPPAAYINLLARLGSLNSFKRLLFLLPNMIINCYLLILSPCQKPNWEVCAVHPIYLHFHIVLKHLLRILLSMSLTNQEFCNSCCSCIKKSCREFLSNHQHRHCLNSSCVLKTVSPLRYWTFNLAVIWTSKVDQFLNYKVHGTSCDLVPLETS